MMLKNILRYSHFAKVLCRPNSIQLIAPVNEAFKYSTTKMKALPRCPINGRDALIAGVDQENGIYLTTSKGDAPKKRERNQVAVVQHDGLICLVKTYQTIECLINEVCSLDKLKHIIGVPKLIDINLKHKQVYQSLVPGKALSALLNENGQTPGHLYLYENKMLEHPEYPLDFSPSSAAKLLSPQFIHKLSVMLNAIHEAGVLIRDVKFGNIMVEGDTPYLVDFDAATLLLNGTNAARLSIAKENNYFNRLLPLNLPEIE